LDETADYAIVFPKKLNDKLRSLSQSKGELSLRNPTMPGQKEMELWKFHNR
jgi:hypothetical protein